MKFFEKQEAARSRTSRLILYFLLGTLATTLSVYLIVVNALPDFGYGAADGVFRLSFGEAPAARGLESHHGPALTPVKQALLRPRTLLIVGSAMALWMAASVASTAKKVRAGGARVAESVGATLAQPARSLDEQQLVNIAEEIAVSARMKAPLAYVLPDATVNAFAAGNDATDAVIGVTRGALDHLSRDELQALVAQASAHIATGNLGVFTRTIAWVHALELFPSFGRRVLRFTPLGYVASTERKGCILGFFLMPLGLTLVATGYAGLLFGRMMKAEIARERQRLSDAVAVEFTRFPSALASALAATDGKRHGSKVRHPGVEAVGHLFVVDPVRGWISTHPPLRERIRAIAPTHDVNDLPTLHDAAWRTVVQSALAESLKRAFDSMGLRVTVRSRRASGALPSSGEGGRAGASSPTAGESSPERP